MFEELDVVTKVTEVVAISDYRYDNGEIKLVLSLCTSPHASSCHEGHIDSALHGSYWHAGWYRG